jgi:prolyl-tRNA editing enzyme YbaK/EbsC (Cys-tRNA(Pro) deacylase)
MTVFDKILLQLRENNIEFKLSEHEAVRTSEEAAKVRGVDIKTGAKAMVIKAKDKYALFVLPADQKINWRKVEKILSVKHLRFATEEEAEELTTVQMGAVPPFGNILNLLTYFDEGLLQNEVVNFNPGSKTHSISMKAKDLVELVKPTIVSFT